MAIVDNKAMGRLLSYRAQLTRQQFKTLRGQVHAGDAEGAMKGLNKILLYKSTNAIIRH